jgi:hypothetical protein
MDSAFIYSLFCSLLVLLKSIPLQTNRQANTSHTCDMMPKILCIQRVDFYSSRPRNYMWKRKTIHCYDQRRNVCRFRRWIERDVDVTVDDETFRILASAAEVTRSSGCQLMSWRNAERRHRSKPDSLAGGDVSHAVKLIGQIWRVPNRPKGRIRTRGNLEPIRFRYRNQWKSHANGALYQRLLTG